MARYTADIIFLFFGFSLTSRIPHIYNIYTFALRYIFFLSLLAIQVDELS